MGLKKKMLNHMNTRKKILRNKINSNLNKITRKRVQNLISKYPELIPLKALSRKLLT